MKGKILSLTSNKKIAIDFLLPKHYSSRKPQISEAYGWYAAGVKDIYDIDKLMAVLTIGKPANNRLCDGICGKENSKYVYELNRLCSVGEWEEPLSQFVSAVLRRHKNGNPMIIVSYSDMGMNHHGYIYQACNFIYTGCTKERKEFYVPNGHSRHGSKDSDLRKIRTKKHRYVYFAGNKKIARGWKSSLRYAEYKYPKGLNENYILGEYQKPIVVNIKDRKTTIANDIILKE